MAQGGALAAATLILAACGAGTPGAAPVPAVTPQPTVSAAVEATSSAAPARSSATPAKRPSKRPSKRPRPSGKPSAGGAVQRVTPVQQLQGPFAVVRVVDGDTVVVATAGGSETLRLIGMDTPETVDPRTPVECYGPEASAFAKREMTGRRVWLELDPSQGSRDKYDRLLAYVWLSPQRLYNEIAIRRGFAIEYTYDAYYAHRDAFLRAQRHASAMGAGLWTDCGGSADLVLNGNGNNGGAGGGGTSPLGPDCDPNYGITCVPKSAADLDCADIDGPVKILGRDPHGFDSNGDGMGCEGN